MYSEGHAGLTLIIFPLLMIPLGWGDYQIIAIGLAVGVSSLPDIDLKYREYGIHHRGVTHSILFAILVGIGLGALFYYNDNQILWFAIGFAGGFGGIMSHLLGDMLTYHAFKPLWPFSDTEKSLGLCRASNKAVNEGLLTAGAVSFVAYFMISTGALSGIIG